MQVSKHYVNYFIIIRSKSDNVCVPSSLSAFSSIFAVANLIELNLSNNRIESVVGLYSAVNLEYLNISFNKLKNIDGLETMKNIKYLQAANNALPSYNSLRSISFHRSLKELDITNNPISVAKNLKMKILQMVPSLQILNECSIRSRTSMQSLRVNDNLKYSSLFERQRLSKNVSPDKIGSPKGNISPIFNKQPTPVNHSQLSRFVIDATNDSAVLDVLNVEFHPPNSVASPSFRNSPLTAQSTPTPTRTLNLVRSQSTDNTSHFIIAAELAPEEIALSSSDLKGTLREGEDPLLLDLLHPLDRGELHGERAQRRAPSRLPWRNPPNPLPRPRKFEKKTHLSPPGHRPPPVGTGIGTGRALHVPLREGEIPYTFTVLLAMNA